MTVVDPTVVEETVTQPVAEGRPRATPVRIPVHRYTSPEFARLEAERLWPSVWQLAGVVDQVAAPGDWFEHRLGHLSVLVLRDDAGALRAYQNVCRHRGSTFCEGSGTGLTELRCPFHRWTWDLQGRLREVPSRKEFGVLNDELPLFEVQVGTWGPLVFVNLAADAPPLEEFLESVPGELAWAGLDEFRCRAIVSFPAECNWKTLIEAFSETYHVQGIHREMLAMTDDVNGPQAIWHRHGVLIQPYGLQSPRIRERLDHQRVWEGFVEVMGARVGASMQGDPGPAPAVPGDRSLRAVLAEMVRDTAGAGGLDYGRFSDDQVLDMHQYNLFPNITVLVMADLFTVVRSRPGATPDDAWMDVFNFARHAPSDPSPRSAPPRYDIPAGVDPPLGLVLGQDARNFAAVQRGLHQPGLTHLAVSPTEECRVVNLHRNLEEHLGIVPSEMDGLAGFPGPAVRPR
jgi:nitrite reductase/ring-hydroxylating ferredoxin subunit